MNGRDAMDVGGAFAAMVTAIRNFGRPGVVGYAISAVDVALWDLKARLLDLPLHRLLGAVRDDVPVYGSGGFTTYDDRQLAEQLTHWALEQRIPRVKIKIGESWGTNTTRDLDRIRQAREIIGDDTELFVDANGGYQRKQAIRVINAAADYDVRWFEEPVSSDDLDGLREIRDAVCARRDGRRVRPRHVLLPADVRRRRGRLPASRRLALRRHHRMAAGWRPSLPATASRSPVTAVHTCTHTPPPPPRTCGTWSGFTTTCGSSRCSSTAPSIPPAAQSVPTQPRQDTALPCVTTTPNATEHGERTP